MKQTAAKAADGSCQGFGVFDTAQKTSGGYAEEPRSVRQGSDLTRSCQRAGFEIAGGPRPPMPSHHHSERPGAHTPAFRIVWGIAAGRCGPCHLFYCSLRRQVLYYDCIHYSGEGQTPERAARRSGPAFQAREPHRLGVHGTKFAVLFTFLFILPII